MKNIKYICFLVFYLLFPQNILSNTTITLSHGQYNYKLTSSEKLTSNNVNLYDRYYSMLLEFNLGSLTLNKTIKNYEEKNFENLNYKTSPLIFKIDSPYAIIFLPTIDIKKYNGKDRSFKEQTLSTWLGVLSYTIKEDKIASTNIKSVRLGLTTSLFSEELRALYNYAYNNPKVINNKYKTKSISNSCKTNFWYIGGNTYCQKNNFIIYGHYAFAYDLYNIDVKHSKLGDGKGEGLKYGYNALVEMRYKLSKNNLIAFGIDRSDYKGSEVITFNDTKIKDVVSRTTNTLSIRFMSHF